MACPTSIHAPGTAAAAAEAAAVAAGERAEQSLKEYGTLLAGLVFAARPRRHLLAFQGSVDRRCAAAGFAALSSELVAAWNTIDSGFLHSIIFMHARTPRTRTHTPTTIIALMGHTSAVLACLLAVALA